MPDRVGILGKRGSGKTALANLLVQRGYTRLSFADPLKDVYVDMFNLFLVGAGLPVTFTRETLEREKELHRPELVRFGTIHGRGRDPECWIRAFASRMQAVLAQARRQGHDARIVVDDVRFLNEAAWLREQGFLLIKVVRDEQQRRRSVERSAFDSVCDALRKDYIDMDSDEQRQFNDLMNTLLDDNLELLSEGEVDLIEADVTVCNTSYEALAYVADRLIERE